MKRELNTLQPDGRAQWRAWLKQNHDKEPGVWLIYFKKHTGKASLSYEDAVEEALCFGWIDSNAQALDAERYMQRFTPRKPGSDWANSNKRRVEKLIREGCMTEAGLAAIEAARQNGSWDKLNAVDNLELPPDLAQALAAAPPAQDHFAALTPSQRKLYIYWVGSAKREETRRRRIAETVSRVAQNIKFGQ